MNEIARGRLDVEIRRHGQVIRTWVLKRIADTPAIDDREREATAWFHQLPLEQRMRLVKDLARVNIKDVNLFEIATGPVGVLFTTYPQLFQIPESRPEVPQAPQVPQVPQVDQDLVDTKEYSTLAVSGSTAGASDPDWYNAWNGIECGLDGPTCPAE